MFINTIYPIISKQLIQYIIWGMDKAPGNCDIHVPLQQDAQEISASST